ncbi:MAG: LXG domain-containing protein [Streptococcaceae bacterium]|jgi:hypothetical protein|nr:LXG domain-containing protein [Streptococcaceae bacterium]
MANDELYYDALTNLAERVAGGLQNRSQPLDELDKVLNQLKSTNTIQGKGADNMKAYIGEVHTTLIQALQLALTNYQMALGKYVKGYLEVDSNHGFQLVREDLEAHQRNLTAHRSDFTSLADQLKAISDEAEDIVWLGGAGGYRLTNVANEMDVMKQTASTLMDRWNAYEQTDSGFAQVQELLARTRDLIKSTLKVPRGYAYSPGSFSQLMSPAFLSALQANSNYAADAKNQKEFSKDWNSITKDYSDDQKRLAEAELAKEKERNRWNGLFTVLGAVVGAIAIVATVATCGLATPLLVAGIAFVASDAAEGVDQMAEGKDKGFNLLRWGAEKGSNAITGSDTAGDMIYGTADFAVGIMTGNEAGKALKVGEYGNAFVSTIKAGTVLDKVQSGVQVANIVPGFNGDSIGGNVQNVIYNASYSEWHNVAVSSVLSHSIDIAGDIHSGGKGLEGTTKGIVEHMFNDAGYKTSNPYNVRNVTQAFANQTNQRVNFAKVVGR